MRSLFMCKFKNRLGLSFSYIRYVLLVFDYYLVLTSDYELFLVLHKSLATASIEPAVTFSRDDETTNEHPPKINSAERGKGLRLAYILLNANSLIISQYFV